jgi:GNAT superfamily N-acetyltransferase
MGPYTLWRLVRPAELLSADEQAVLLGMIARESTKVFSHDISPYWRSRPGYFRDLREWWIAEAGGAPVAWCGVQLWTDIDRPILYIDTLSVMPGHRRTGLGAILVYGSWMRAALRLGTVPTMAFRTESPIVFRMLRRFMGAHNTYPAFTETGDIRSCASDALVGVARAAARETAWRTGPGKPFDDRKFVLHGALEIAGSLYGSTVPTSGDPMIDELFSTTSPDAGDVVICITLGKLRTFLRNAPVYAMLVSRLRVRCVADPRRWIARRGPTEISRKFFRSEHQQ